MIQACSKYAQVFKNPMVKSRLTMSAKWCASLIQAYRALFLALEDAQNLPSGRTKDVRLNLELLQVPG